MKQIKHTVLVLFLGMAQMLTAQNPEFCGTVPTSDMIQRTLANKAAAADGIAVQFRDGITYVPIKFHLISKIDGSFRISEARVFDALCKLNEEFADMDVQFYIYQGFSYINNDVAYDNPGDNNNLLLLRKEGRAMNIYIGNNANSGSNSPGQTLGYYDPGGDWIVIRKGEVTANSVTLPHEVGHYFSLLHPFNGWECTPGWNATDFGNPVNITTAPCPSLVDGAAVDVENVARTGSDANCETAGDFLCDTPAEYKFGFGDNDCEYQGNCMDPTGTQLDPMENNMMSYWLVCPDHEFTPEQEGLIIADIESRTALETDYSPIATEITETPTLNYPIDGEEIAYNTVNFNWTAVDGADRYILEFDIDANFSLIPERILVWGNFKSVDGLFLQEQTYYWRVRPANGYYTCAGYSDAGTFNTNDVVSVDDISTVEGWSIMPNPLRSGEELTVEILANKSFEGQMVLRDLSGRQLWANELAFANGMNRLFVPTANLSAGVYFLSVATENGMMTERVIIGR